MIFAENEAVKVLCGGRSWHGGEHEWSLPTKADDGSWTPGDWTPAVEPSMCSRGWHLTREPAVWWGSAEGVVGYLAQWEGAHVAREDKIAVERCRLLRPLTRAELESCGVFAEGVHAVSSGRAWASGSATVRAWDSATVEAWDSATVMAADSAKVHAWGRATATAWAAPTVVLTREEQGVLIDRRGSGAPRVYVKRAGLDGWRYRGGTWVRVEVKAKTNGGCDD